MKGTLDLGSILEGMFEANVDKGMSEMDAYESAYCTANQAVDGIYNTDNYAE